MRGGICRVPSPFLCLKLQPQGRPRTGAFPSCPTTSASRESHPQHTPTVRVPLHGAPIPRRLRGYLRVQTPGRGVRPESVPPAWASEPLLLVPKPVLWSCPFRVSGHPSLHFILQHPICPPAPGPLLQLKGGPRFPQASQSLRSGWKVTCCTQAIVWGVLVPSFHGGIVGVVNRGPRCTPSSLRMSGGLLSCISFAPRGKKGDNATGPQDPHLSTEGVKCLKHTPGLAVAAVLIQAMDRNGSSGWTRKLWVGFQLLCPHSLGTRCRLSVPRPGLPVPVSHGKSLWKSQSPPWTPSFPREQTQATPTLLGRGQSRVARSEGLRPRGCEQMLTAPPAPGN